METTVPVIDPQVEEYVTRYFLKGRTVIRAFSEAEALWYVAQGLVEVAEEDFYNTTLSPEHADAIAAADFLKDTDAQVAMLVEGVVTSSDIGTLLQMRRLWHERTGKTLKNAKTLDAENKLLKAQLQAQADRADFIEDCIAEMAMLVYVE